MRLAVGRDFAALPGVRLLTLPAGEPEAVLAGACGRGDAALVIAPESQGTLERLAALVAACDTLPLGPGPRSVRLASDKRATMRLLKEAGVPVPPAARSGAAVVFKPRRGCGAEGVIIARRAAERARARRLAARAARGDGIVTERFVAGIAASASFLVRAGGDGSRPGDLLSLGLGRQELRGRVRLAYAGGEVPWTGAATEVEAAGVPGAESAAGSAAVTAARDAVTALARASGDLRGFVGVDLVIGAEGPVVIEINPRLTSSYLGLRRRFGPALARLMIAAARGEALPASLPGDGRWRFDAGGAVRPA
ncbi:MAG TPA: ATP-grasp domain-containing protein [Verrucomicrobiae bacterium]|nr:ATP-grasp domain-containing protein [Verrucomicrobiae bacterium]